MDDSIDHVPRFALQFILHRRSPGLAPVPRTASTRKTRTAANRPLVAHLDGAIRIDRGSIHQPNRPIALRVGTEGAILRGEIGFNLIFFRAPIVLIMAYREAPARSVQADPTTQLTGIMYFYLLI